MTPGAQSGGDGIIEAAGTVLWRYRRSDGDAPAERGPRSKREFAVIHRPHYDDWSLPKGKLDPGETAAAAAARETAEETGCIPRLGRYLQPVSYPMHAGRTKSIEYWEAEAVGGQFTANAEVDQVRWLRFRDAVELLTHDLDRAVLARFRARRPGDATVVLIRHASAGRRGEHHGPDTERPLDAKGRAQACLLVPQTSAFAPAAVHAADRVRCAETVAPLAEQLETGVIPEPALSEEAYACDPRAAHARILKIAHSGRATAVCSQSGVIPELVRWWANRDGVALADTRTRKAATWVLTLRRGRLVAADRMPPPTVTCP